MGYINPYLVEGGVLFREAQEKGYFVRRADGSDYLFDFGEYDCGVVDLTLPSAFDWYKNVIVTNLIGTLGIATAACIWLFHLGTDADAYRMLALGIFFIVLPHAAGWIVSKADEACARLIAFKRMLRLK